MKTINKFNLGALSLIFLLSACTQKTETSNAPEDTKADEASVKEVMLAYKSGIEALSADGLTDLFMKDSEVFESGGVEGSFDHYLEHHLAPELQAFESFQFSDYSISTKIELPFAFSTETYDYTIVLASDGRTIVQRGVATSILRKVQGKWRILKTHTSARAKRQSGESDH